MDDLQLILPSAGPDPIPLDDAVAAVLGYARGRRPFWFRSPSQPAGSWVQIPAFGYERFDCRPAEDGDLGDADILVAEGLHGRLDPVAWAAVRTMLDHVGPLYESLTDAADGRAFWDLPDDQLSVLGEPGTVGAALREIWTRCADTRDVRPEFVSAALHHRRPDLVPHIDPTTLRQLLQHMVEGDSGVEAVVHRELRDNAIAFQALETMTDVLLRRDGSAPLTRLRLHDILVWLSGSLRLTHALLLGRATVDWELYRASA